MSDPSTPSHPYILFEIAGTTYGIATEVVQQMEMIDHITPVPNAAPFVEGVVFSRGQVIPTISLRVRFGLEKIPYDTRSRLIVLHTQGRTLGIIADTAREFVVIPDTAIQPPPESITGLSYRYLSGIATLKERLILILNVEEVMNWHSDELEKKWKNLDQVH
jgi:purine-binding chemotaxis protein CheW